MLTKQTQSHLAWHAINMDINLLDVKMTETYILYWYIYIYFFQMFPVENQSIDFLCNTLLV